MSITTKFFSCLKAVFCRAEMEDDLSEELRFHLEKQIEKNIASGMSPQAARYAALRSFGGVEQIKEECRDRRGAAVIESFIQDARYGFRMLAKSPGFTAVAVLTIALGIGAGVAIFGFVDATLIKPLPYKDQSRLVDVFATTPTNTRGNVSYLDYIDWRNLNRVFSSIDAYDVRNGFTLSTTAGAQRVAGIKVTVGFFRTLGVTPVLGRDFHPGEDLPSAPQTVLLSYSAWQKRFGGRQDALGQAVTLDGIPNVIIGVLPRDFHFAPAEPAEFWRTIRAVIRVER